MLGVGLVLAYILFRRRDDGSGGAMFLPQTQPMAGLELLGVGASQRRLPAPRAAVNPESTIRTYTLPSITVPSEAYRLATAPVTANHRVTVRVIAPQGGLALLAFSSNELAAPGGNTMMIPVGQHQEIRLHPGQALYGKGQAPGVMVSVIQTEAPRDGG